jgi:hypothetical protein
VEWIKTAEDATREVFSLVDAVRGEQAYDKDGNPVGDIPTHRIPVTDVAVEDALKEVAKFTKDKSVDYVQAGKSGVIVRLSKEGDAGE